MWSVQERPGSSVALKLPMCLISIEMDCPPFLPASSTKPRRDRYDRTAGAGGVFFPDRGGSAWITAHWGWMPPREYTAFLQTGHVGLVEIGVCQRLSATRFSPCESRGSPRGRDARSDAPPPDDAWIDQ